MRVELAGGPGDALSWGAFTAGGCNAVGGGGDEMGPGGLVEIRQRMLAGFKLDIANMRSAGATQGEIDLMLDEFDDIYAHHDEGKLVIAILRQAARPSYPPLFPLTFRDFRAVH